MGNKNFDVNDVDDEQLARTIFGEEGLNGDGGLDPMIFQGSEGICAIRSQQIILRDYGIDVSIDELKNFAIQNGWYSPENGGGTPLNCVGNLLESCNVECRQDMNCTVYDLANELGQGHRVIVAVDANELWADRENDYIGKTREWFNDIFKGDTPNHALIVAGIEIDPDDPENTKVILTDPGTGDLRIEYELDEFMDAWKDSHCFMTTTLQPAPLQYDPSTGSEIPSNFAINEYIHANTLPLDANNIIVPEQMAAMCSDAYYTEGHIDSIPFEGHDVSFEDYSIAVGNAQKFKSGFGGLYGNIGNNVFDKDAFISSIRSMLGIEHSTEHIGTGEYSHGPYSPSDENVDTHDPAELFMDGGDDAGVDDADDIDSDDDGMSDDDNLF